MAERKLKPAAKNPWYVLMTIYGEQEGPGFDSELAEKNRRAWNAWSCQALTDERRAELAKDMKLNVSELSAWPELEEAITARFRKRLGTDSAIPDVLGGVYFRNVAFSCILSMERTIFTQEVLFAGSTFTQAAIFSHAKFTKNGVFSGVTFERSADFSHATFLKSAQFNGASFAEHATFSGVKTLQKALFDNVRFTDIVDFRGAIFSDDANFIEVIFKQDAWFFESTFAHDVFFNRATVTKSIFFSGATFSKLAFFDRTTFQGRVYFNESRFVGFEDNKVGYDLSQAIFWFCEFQRSVTFREAVFADLYPDWTGAILPKNIEFTVDDAGKDNKSQLVRYWPDDAKVDPVSSRASCAVMRHALNQQGLPEAEHFFYRKEMGFAGKAEPFPRNVPYLIFGWASNFGNSIARPAGLLGLSIVLFWLIYLAAFVWDATLHGGTKTGAEALGLSFANTFGFLGLHRLYFETGYFAALPAWMKIAGAFQSVLGVILLFFLGLGLRTRFRLR